MRLYPALMLIAALGSSLANTPFRAYDQTFIDAAPYNFVLLEQVDSSETAQAPIQKQPLAPKNKGKAMFLSLLIPGLGQHYADAKTKSAVFLGVEIGLWLTYGGLTAHGNWRQNDYEVYAATHADVNLEGKNYTYFIDVGNFDNIYEHNEYRLEQRNFKKYYQDIDFWFWDWESKAHMEKFDDLRIAADTANNRAKFILGAIVANHIISAVDAVWSVHQYEKKRFANLDWDVQFGDGTVRPVVNIYLAAHF